MPSRNNYKKANEFYREQPKKEIQYSHYIHEKDNHCPQPVIEHF